MATPMSEIPAHRPRAFVVDDSQIARYILSGQLERLGFAVEVADSAESALRQLKAPLPDVVFMDHLLPGIDGLEAVSRLRGQSGTAGLPVVMYTSQDGDAFLKRARAVGADDVYVKAAAEDRLPEILDRLCLLPEAPTESKSNVRSIGRAPSLSAAAPRSNSLSREELARLLEPSLEAHHAKLHQELLAEFAILERYEERMRRDLFARVEMLARRTSERVDGAFDEDQAGRRRTGRRQLLATWSMAAMLAVAVALGALQSWHTAQQSVELEATATTALQAVEANSAALAQFEHALDERLSGFGTVPAQNLEEPFAERRSRTQRPPGAAAALVTELKAMGIVGPVRIETDAGSFCVMTAPHGLNFIGANASLHDCSSFPMQLTTASLVQ